MWTIVIVETFPGFRRRCGSASPSWFSHFLVHWALIGRIGGNWRFASDRIGRFSTIILRFSRFQFLKDSIRLNVALQLPKVGYFRRIEAESIRDHIGQWMKPSNAGAATGQAISWFTVAPRLIPGQTPRYCFIGETQEGDNHRQAGELLRTFDSDLGEKIHVYGVLRRNCLLDMPILARIPTGAWRQFMTAFVHANFSSLHEVGATPKNLLQIAELSWLPEGNPCGWVLRTIRPPAAMN